ncbi:GH10523 [Drosophila grimshawi]|uniref:GH10523 n=1 Tax=Drosophila grimshawi TaxID=7222 RepID=B4JDN3_DROGR|nr:GH10523 [Drosophila grimshawi]
MDEEYLTLETESETEPNIVIDPDGNRSIAFPLPQQEDPSICRDEFLKIILKPYELVSEVMYDVSTRRETFQMESGVTAEGMAIMKMLKTQRKVVLEDAIVFRPSLTWEEKQMLYKKVLDQFQKSAIEFLSVRLRKQIDTIMHIWPGESEEIPHKLFYWSLEHFQRRQKVNQLYLEVLPIERTRDDLDCSKFCTDIKEIKRLLAAIKLDFSKGNDLCKSALVLLDESNYEYNSTWVSELDHLRNAHQELALNKYVDIMRNSSDSGARMLADNDKAEAIMHIETRYRIKWMRCAGEQHLMWLEAKESTFQNEIEELKLKVKNDEATFAFVDFVYQYQIDNYRASIAIWQDQLDADLEKAELECNITRNHWTKAKDDLKFFKEQVEMFKARVEEVNELIAAEEREKLRSRMSSVSFNHLIS